MIWKWIILLAQFCVLGTSLLNKNACKMIDTPGNNKENHVRCNGDFPDAESLKSNLHNITKTINIFELCNVSIDALPEDIFYDMKDAIVQKVLISHSSIELLNTPEYSVSPFKSIEDTVESFEVYNSSSIFAWNISVFASLKKLQTIIIENSDYIHVKDSFRDFSNLRFVQFLNSGIRWIHSQVFRYNKKLTICSLSNNLISEIKRSMFPLPAENLWSLDLSFNNLKKLPNDMFIGMPSLQELKLDNNHLKVVRAPLLNPVWNHLTQLWLDGNDEICWALCWISKRHNRPQFLESLKCSLNKPLLLDSFLKLCKH